EVKLLKRKKGEAKSAAVAPRKEAPAPTAALHKNDKNVKAPPGTKKPAATLDPPAAKRKKSLKKILGEINKQPAGRGAPAASNLDPCKNDQASKDPVSASPSNKSGREEKKTRDDTTPADGVEEDDDESVDDLQDARSEPHGAGHGEADEGDAEMARGTASFTPNPHRGRQRRHYYHPK
ncbi:unnamed protein product, partial [Ectocarpus sp. 6 AP-2014]